MAVPQSLAVCRISKRRRSVNNCSLNHGRYGISWIDQRYVGSICSELFEKRKSK